MSIDIEDCETIEPARTVALASIEQNGVRFDGDDHVRRELTVPADAALARQLASCS